MSRFYITTPIYYINAEPHLGHAYTTMVADAVARAHRLTGRRGVLPDRHRRARPEGRAGGAEGRRCRPGRSPTRSRRSSATSCRLLNISNDDFIRTTEPRHYAASQALWRRVRDRGYIYKGKYEGWYCTVDEVFVPETQLVRTDAVRSAATRSSGSPRRATSSSCRRSSSRCSTTTSSIRISSRRRHAATR